MTFPEQNDHQLETMQINLKLLREQKSWSINDLSQISGIESQILSDIENGEDVDIAFIFKLCRIYGKTLHEIFLPL